MKLKPSLVLAAAITLCANAAFAQGTMLYTWHGNNNLFQASFQIYDYQQTPGSYFEYGPFAPSFTVTSLDHVFLPGTFSSATDAGNGYLPYLKFTVRLTDPSFPGATIYAFCDDSLVGADEIHEQINHVNTSGEGGYWSFAPVPEPSAVSLLTLGLLALLGRRQNVL
jgi:PEP-CTERM motif